MKWKDIHRQYPNRFVLLGNLVEEKISDFEIRIVEGTIIDVFDNGPDVQKAYIAHKQKGEDVLFSLPTTPEDFIIENVPYKGLIR